KTIRVLLADDHQIVIEGLRLILSAQSDMEVIGDCANGTEVLGFLEHQPADVLVLDINMPKMDGISCAKKVKAKFPKTKIIILTMYAQKSFIEEVIKIGIDGCLLKNNTGKELADAIRRVQSGKSYYDRIQSFSSNENKIKDYQLSEREVDIIKCLADGLSSSQMADKLFISIHTVRTHRKNILRKLDLHNSPELIQYAINHGIL
ncbi:MAG: response regulator transcription factor, partial [Bacteroidota bacterium]